MAIRFSSAGRAIILAVLAAWVLAVQDTAAVYFARLAGLATLVVLAFIVFFVASPPNRIAELRTHSIPDAAYIRPLTTRTELKHSLTRLSRSASDWASYGAWWGFALAGVASLLFSPYAPGVIRSAGEGAAFGALAGSLLGLVAVVREKYREVRGAVSSALADGGRLIKLPVPDPELTLQAAMPRLVRAAEVTVVLLLVGYFLLGPVSHRLDPHLSAVDVMNLEWVGSGLLLIMLGLFVHFTRSAYARRLRAAAAATRSNDAERQSTPH
jgi:hypothetical protein